MTVDTLTSQDYQAPPALVGERLTVEAFEQLAGTLSGHRFVKVVVDRPAGVIHFIDNNRYAFHAYYIAEHILHIPREELEANVDQYNHAFYADPDRRLYLGLLSMHAREDDTGTRRFLCLETVEVDTMSTEMLRYFYAFVADRIDPGLPLLFKPATHRQELQLSDVPATEMPRISAHEIFSAAPFVALQPGVAQGRLRAFRDEDAYRRADPPLQWYDIIAMDRVPDDIPRLAGIINAQHTTPLSHTNVLAAGWAIPNAIQLDAFGRIDSAGLDGTWVRYEVVASADAIALTPIERPDDLDRRPAWVAQQVTVEEPEVHLSPIAGLDEIRAGDRYRYGTKAANLGELHHVLSHGSERLLGFYRTPRPPRRDLLGYLQKLLDVPGPAGLAQAANRLLRELVWVPRGIALPFSLQREFLESSPAIQQTIGKLKMALELDAREVESLCLELQRLVRRTRVPDSIRSRVDDALVTHLGGVASFVVRSSSNAEDLAGFSAAGIYESVNHVTTADHVMDSLKTVWASLLSPRSVRLRQQAGISLDDSYMGVVIQEEVASTMGGVMVTTNPLTPADFRNVYLNVSTRSVTDVVAGSHAPMQYLFNTVEGGGRTVSLGDAERDLPEAGRARLQRLAVAGRLLQAHFSPDYTFSAPVDIEWVADDDRIAIVQLRPYSA
ncbi:phosphoenolpyruvate synthase [Couchioplanes caeruleus subsp. caeruleus]|uniref:Phosphoenolpyruvate synthase n=1 Tax=Couchioplanes caeruleus subsp. caeruleus TaxID=56427 RepID=A0A1K0FNN6_9ACTN|nr:phosphoenolpyruvate synthase [Couchioplanes caeruleus subsp. caeruleus]